MSTPVPPSSGPFLDALKFRRSYYALQKSSSITDDKLHQLVSDSIISVPSSFNGQGNRLLVLLGAEHEQFWAFVWDAVKSHVEGQPDKEKSTRARLDGFKGAYGTILFFDDPDPREKLAARFPNYADKFPQWADHSSGMLQYALWVALEAEGMGCNLQHYNPIVDVQVKQRWNVPSAWDLKAQLVFGKLKDGEKRKGWTEGKDVVPVEQRVFVHGA